MVEITKQEAFHLGDQGYQWKKDIHVTGKVRKKYYATEEPKILKELERYRRSKIVGEY